MNRVSSELFPNTIWGVIFDRKYGVQFSPVANGTIYDAPSYSSILAAKICLEGFSVSDEILYFLAPRYATSSWISQNRDYVFTVENHEFYA
jgi:N-acetylmuramoyl-L-alanine amidase